MKIGTRLYASAGGAAVIVIRSGPTPAVITCAGQPMLDAAPVAAPPVAGEPLPLGKRYAADGIELLVTAAGTGPLCVDGTVLELMEPKRLPASD